MIPITDHVDQGLGVLIQDYQDKPDMAAWVSSFAQEVQELEDAIFAVFLARDVDSATGDALHQIGRRVGVQFQGQEQEDYRLLVKANIRANRSHGQWRDLNQLAALFFPGGEWSWERHGKTNVLRITNALAERPSLSQRLLERATSAGGRTDIHYSVDPEADRFAFGSEGGGFSDGGLGGRVSSYGT